MFSITKKIIYQTICYIEEYLKTEISHEELASQAGYSLYYFYRLFSSTTNKSLSSYILDRKLEHILSEISLGKSAVDAALDYGFATYAGFYKAFVREYGCSPKKYLSIYGLQSKITKQKEEIFMKLTHKEIRSFLQHWPLNSSVKISDVPIMNGEKISEKRWKIGKDYYLTVSPNPTKELKSIAVAKALLSQGFQAPVPILTKDGQEFLENDYFIVLKQRVQGTTFSNSDFYKNQELATNVGYALAKLHQAFLSLENQILCDPSDLFSLVSQWALPNVKKQVTQWSLAIPEAFFDDYLTIFETLEKGLPRQIIHRDPNPENILFIDNSVSGFIDFELVEKNIRLFDPCYSATAILSGTKKEDYEQWFQILENILLSYDKENALSTEEKQAIFYVICSIQMICVAYFAENDQPNFKKLAQVNRQMLEFIVQNKERITKIFP